jgi:tRNA (guanine-N7-)-methyltransferase
MGRILKEYLQAVIDPEDLDGRIDFAQIFGRPGLIHIEVGSGKGTFLVNQAKAQPNVNFLGIEWARKYYRFAVDRIGRWGLTNVRLIRTDAVTLVKDHVSDNSVDCFHIYFPDPWPKRRHHKKRFLCTINLDNLIRSLKPLGQIRIATDHAEYFDSIKRLMAANPDTLREIEFFTSANTTAGLNPGEWVGTNFERKYLKEGRTIFTTAIEKIY